MTLWDNVARSQDDHLARTRMTAPPVVPRATWTRLRLASAALLIVTGVAGTVGTVVKRREKAAAVARANVPHVPAMGAAGATLEAAVDRALPIRFADGSQVVLQPTARARVNRLTDTGADLTIEDGRLEASILHAARTSWVFHAGPFAVHVTGTRFSAAWMPGTRTLTVTMREGSVLIDGGLLGAGVALRAGQTLTVAGDSSAITLATGTSARAESDDAGANTAAERSRNDNAITPSPDRAPERAGMTNNAAPTHATATLVPAHDTQRLDARPATNPAPRHPLNADPWSALAAQGRYDEALQAAEREGFSALCRTRDAEAVLVLGDIARYANATARARASFEALVARFPNAAEAAAATFSLGRLAFDANEMTDARVWFSRYESRWPDGPLADQALGRALEAEVALGDNARARATAQRYLARFPDGLHADLARRWFETAAPAP